MDTNGPFLAETLQTLGMETRRLTVVGDDRSAIAGALRESLRRADLVCVAGGLGPTGDDLTRETVAGVMGRRLRLDHALLEDIRKKFSMRRLKMSPNNRVQALVPRGAILLPNPHGTAPGFLLIHGRQVIVVLPGPPRELQPMMINHAAPFLRQRFGIGERVRVRVLKAFGLAESAIDQRLRYLFSRKNPVLALLASHTEVKIKFTARGDSERTVQRLLDGVERDVRRRLGRAVFGRDGETLSSVVGELLKGKKWTLALAESCTGGLIGHYLTNTPGSSEYFDRGAVTYSDQSKRAWLKVPPFLLKRHGAVSAKVAKAMAQGIRQMANTHVGLAVTGIAGPGGGSAAKPVGLVYIALAWGSRVVCREYRFHGSREVIKERTAQTALNLLRLALS